MTSDQQSAGPPPHREDAVDSVRVPVPDDQSPPDELTKQDYARTTGGSPAATALIPAIREEVAASPPPVTPPPAAVEEPKPVADPDPDPAPASPLATGRTAGLRLVRVEPYSVTRLAFVISVALMIVSVVAVAIFWIVLAITGIWGQINDSVASLLSDDSASFDIKDYLGFGRLVGGALVISGINVILMTALATVGAHLYNLAAALLGGVDATFTDE